MNGSHAKSVTPRVAGRAPRVGHRPDPSPQAARGRGRERRPEPQIVIEGSRDPEAIAAVMREWLAPALAELFLDHHGWPRPRSSFVKETIPGFPPNLGIKPKEKKCEIGMTAWPRIASRRQ